MFDFEQENYTPDKPIHDPLSGFFVYKVIVLEYKI